MARPMKFASSYLAQSEKKGVDIDATVDRSLRSYMGMGDAAFADEKIGDVTRKDTIAKIRKNTLQRMRQENAASVKSATKQSTDHQNYATKVLSDITDLKTERAKAMAAETDYYDELIRRNGEKSTGLGKYFSKLYWYEKSMKSHFEKTDAKVNKVRTDADSWRTDKERKYKENVFQKHYKAYDDLAKTYYEITREFTRPAQSVQPDTRVSQALDVATAVTEPAKKPEVRVPTKDELRDMKLPDITGVSKGAAKRAQAGTGKRVRSHSISEGQHTIIPVLKPVQKPQNVIAPQTIVQPKHANVIPPAYVPKGGFLDYKDPVAGPALVAVLAKQSEAWKENHLPLYNAKQRSEGRYSISHYVTVTGIDRAEGKLQIYDSSGYAGAPKKVSISEFLQDSTATEINWISKIDDQYGLVEQGKDPKSMSEAIDLSITHTMGETRAKTEGSEVSAVYIPEKDPDVETITLDELIASIKAGLPEDSEKIQKINGIDQEAIARIRQEANAAAERKGEKSGSDDVSAADDELAYGIHPLAVAGMNLAYEKQPDGSYNCYAVTGAAMLNQYLAMRASEESKTGEVKRVTQEVDQTKMRNYKPKMRKMPLGDGEGAYQEQATQIYSYAGRGKRALGNIFEMGDFMLQTLAENGITDARLNKHTMHYDKVSQVEEDAFADRIEQIMRKGVVAGVMTTKVYGEESKSGKDISDEDWLKGIIKLWGDNAVTLSEDLADESAIPIAMLVEQQLAVWANEEAVKTSKPVSIDTRQPSAGVKTALTDSMPSSVSKPEEETDMTPVVVFISTYYDKNPGADETVDDLIDLFYLHQRDLLHLEKDEEMFRGYLRLAGDKLPLFHEKYGVWAKKNTSGAAYKDLSLKDMIQGIQEYISWAAEQEDVGEIPDKEGLTHLIDTAIKIARAIEEKKIQRTDIARQIGVSLEELEKLLRTGAELEEDEPAKAAADSAAEESARRAKIKRQLRVPKGTGAATHTGVPKSSTAVRPKGEKTATDVKGYIEQEITDLISRSQALKQRLPNYQELTSHLPSSTTGRQLTERRELLRYLDLVKNNPKIEIDVAMVAEIREISRKARELDKMQYVVQEAEGAGIELTLEVVTATVKTMEKDKAEAEEDDLFDRFMPRTAPPAKTVPPSGPKSDSSTGTSSSAVTSSSVPAPAPAPAPKKDEREIPDDAAKKIVEYTGIYDANKVDQIISSVLTNPNTPVSAGDLSIVDYRGRTAASNTFDPVNHLKTHTNILMYSQADATTGIRTRYKLDRRFTGRRSKKQFTPQSKDVPTAVSIAQIDLTRRNAEDMNLESDERDVNGGFLYSEANAEIIGARVKRTGRTVHGFFMNGHFVSDEDASGAPNGEVADIEGMSWWRSPNWEKREKAEKLRVAIRKSLFFQHVNARTIQYYSSYQGDEYTGAVISAVEDRVDAASQGPGAQSLTTATQMLMGANPDFSQIVPALIGPALAGYLITKTDPTYKPPRGQKRFPVNDPKSDRVIADALQECPNELTFACLMLLSEEDPRLWTLARNITEVNIHGIAVRTQSKLDYLPESGELMRMALIEELATRQGRGLSKKQMSSKRKRSRAHQQETDAYQESNEELDLLGELDLPGKKVLQEELDSRRGTGNWFKRNLLNGNLIRHVLRAGELGVEVAGSISDIGGEQYSGWGNEEERAERRFWFNYAEGVSNMTSTFSIFSMMFTGAMAMEGFSKHDGGAAAGMGRDLSFDVMGITEGVANVILMVKEIGKCVSKIRQWWRLRKPENAHERSETLMDRDATGLKSALRALDCMATCVSCARDIASIHVTSSGGPMSFKNDNWGELLKSKGILDKIITNIRRIIRIIDDIREIVVSAKRIGRIDTADSEIETAIAAFDATDKAGLEGMRVVFTSDIGTMFEDESSQEEIYRNMLGEAASQNSQAQYLMALTRKQSKRNIVGASFNIATNVLEGVDDIVEAAKAPPLLRVFTLLAPKVVEFAGWITKTGMDRSTLSDSIERTLGDKQFAAFRYPYFDDVLKRETGIVNKHYLVDLARIFTAIDTHAMIHNPDATPGEMELGKKVAGTMFGNVNDVTVKKVKLEDLMRYAGVDGSSNWRALLRNSLMA